MAKKNGLPAMDKESVSSLTLSDSDTAYTLEHARKVTEYLGRKAYSLFTTDNIADSIGGDNFQDIHTSLYRLNASQVFIFRTMVHKYKALSGDDPAECTDFRTLEIFDEVICHVPGRFGKEADKFHEGLVGLLDATDEGTDDMPDEPFNSW